MSPIRSFQSTQLQTKPATRAASERMRFFHTTSESRQPRVSEILAVPPHEIPTSSSTATITRTRQAEARFRLKPSFYLYAGRSCSDFGSMPLAFDPKKFVGQDAESTPFDTGGVHAGHLSIPEESPEAFVEQNCRKLDVWFELVSAYIDEYFESPLDYLGDVGPKCDNSTGFFGCNKGNWRSWTFEIRSHRPVRIFDTVKWCSTETNLRALRLALVKSIPTALDKPQDLDRFFDRLLGVDEAPCRMINQWSRSRFDGSIAHD